MSAEHTSDGVIPSPETVVEKSLKKAPDWIRKAVLNGLALAGWGGLISTVVSTLSGLRWVIDLALALYKQGGVLLDITLPAWAPDIFTLIALAGMATLRRVLRAAWAETVTSAIIPSILKFTDPDEPYVPLPRRFPFADYFAENFFEWTPRGLREAQRLWRKWRKWQITRALWREPYDWPTFDLDRARAQFVQYWIRIMDGRRDMFRYLFAIVVIVVALGIDWAL